MGNTIHPRRTGGMLSAIVDGEEKAVRGEAEYRLSGVQNEAIDNANGTTSIGGKFVSGYIKFAIANYNDTDHGWLKDLEDATIQLCTANGKVIVASNAFQTDESVGNVESGQFSVQFASERVEEVR